MKYLLCLLLLLEKGGKVTLHISVVVNSTYTNVTPAHRSLVFTLKKLNSPKSVCVCFKINF